MVIGHEITHGFDDKGRQFDKDGNMMQWWNEATVRAFRERAQCIVDQYSRYKLQEVNLYINGRMTQGENIADNGGLKQSFRVRQLFFQTQNYTGCPSVDGATEAGVILHKTNRWKMENKFFSRETLFSRKSTFNV